MRNFVVYKLEICDHKYVGSTSNYLKRLSNHKSNTKLNRHNNKLYKKIRELGGWDNVNKQIIDCYESSDSNLKNEIENYYIKFFNCNLNTYSTIYDKQKELRSKSKYRNKNRHFINQKFKCECGGNYTRTNKARHIKSIKHQKLINI